jgi:hypothetical protein
MDLAKSRAPEQRRREPERIRKIRFGGKQRRHFGGGAATRQQLRNKPTPGTEPLGHRQRGTLFEGSFSACLIAVSGAMVHGSPVFWAVTPPFRT